MQKLDSGKKPVVWKRTAKEGKKELKIGCLENNGKRKEEGAQEPAKEGKKEL